MGQERAMNIHYKGLQTKKIFQTCNKLFVLLSSTHGFIPRFLALSLFEMKWGGYTFWLTFKLASALPVGMNIIIANISVTSLTFSCDTHLALQNSIYL